MLISASIFSQDFSTNGVYVMMKARLPALFKKEEEYEILDTFQGRRLEGKGYKPIFPYFGEFKEKGAFRVLCDKYVTEESGTGVVHQVRGQGRGGDDEMELQKLPFVFSSIVLWIFFSTLYYAGSLFWRRRQSGVPGIRYHHA